MTSLQDLRLAQPAGDEQWRQARALVEAYADALGIDLSFQDFAHELEHLAVEYGPPGGAFLLAQSGAPRAGCAVFQTRWVNRRPGSDPVRPVTYSV